jgi:hypothetical protein
MEDNFTVEKQLEEIPWKIYMEDMYICMYIYIYIYIYINSPVLPITRGSPGRMVQSGRVGPGPDVYKTGPGVLRFSFLRFTLFH